MSENSSGSDGVLVLCEQHDLSALWAAHELRQRCDGPVDVITGALLGSALSWEHRLRGDVAEVEITLVDGRRVSSARPRPVLNRLCYAPVDRLRTVGGEDSDYAVQEFQALFLSWLTAMPGPMLNRPSPQFLAGHWRNPAGWAVLAARAGLPTPPLRQSSAGPCAPMHTGADRRSGVTVFVVAGEVVAPPDVPPPMLDACRRLAELAGDALLGIELIPAGDHGWEFVTATPIPDLRLGGEPILDILAVTLGDFS